MAALHGDTIVDVSLQEATAELKTVPPEWYDVAQGVLRLDVSRGRVSAVCVKPPDHRCVGAAGQTEVDLEAARRSVAAAAGTSRRALVATSSAIERPVRTDSSTSRHAAHRSA